MHDYIGVNLGVRVLLPCDLFTGQLKGDVMRTTLVQRDDLNRRDLVSPKDMESTGLATTNYVRSSYSFHKDGNPFEVTVD